MAEVKECFGFETFGEDVRALWEALGMGRKELAEEADISYRYPASIELGEAIPSIPVTMRLIRICCLPAEQMASLLSRLKWYSTNRVYSQSSESERICDGSLLDFRDSRLSRR